MGAADLDGHRSYRPGASNHAMGSYEGIGPCYYSTGGTSALAVVDPAVPGSVVALGYQGHLF